MTSDEELIQAVRARLRDYNRLSPDSRRDALKGLWNRIRREIGRDITPEVEKQAEPEPQAQREPAPATAPAQDGNQDKEDDPDSKPSTDSDEYDEYDEDEEEDPRPGSAYRDSRQTHRTAPQTRRPAGCA